MSEQAKKNLRWLWLAALVLVADLVVKHCVSTHMMLGESISVLPFFNITLAHNYGAAFSFLHDAGGWQRWFFAFIALGVSAGLLWWLTQIKAGAQFLVVALVLILGGAIGNLHDRIVLGYVVDFLHVHYGTWHFPAFNIADAGISVGTAMLFIDAVFFEAKRERAAAQSAAQPIAQPTAQPTEQSEQADV